MNRGGRPAQLDDRRDQKGRTEIVSTTRIIARWTVWRHPKMVDVYHSLTFRVEDTERQSGRKDCGVRKKSA
jgi:hypothetical protein